MATTEKNGTMKYKDSAGNVTAMYPKTKMSQVEGLNAAIEEAKPFVVTVTRITASDGTKTYAADKTYAEIVAAIDAGKHCYANLTNGSGSSLAVLTLSARESGILSFTSTIVGDSDIAIATLTIISDNKIFVEPLGVQNLITAVGLLKSNSSVGTISAAVAGTDYVTPEGMNTAIQTAIQNTWEASY